MSDIREKILQMAEAAATSVSRRGFLGWLGKGALAVGAVLAMSDIARAVDRVRCCTYHCTGRFTGTKKVCLGIGITCPGRVSADGTTCVIASNVPLADCSTCH
jgi:hypothetical protein